MLFRFVYVPYTCSTIKKTLLLSLFLQKLKVVLRGGGGSGDSGEIFFFSG